jgi:hypothetical protein
MIKLKHTNKILVFMLGMFISIFKFDHDSKELSYIIKNTKITNKINKIPVDMIETTIKN